MAEVLTLKVTGMTCGGCESAVRRVLSMIDGVTAATASHRDDQITVTYDPGKASRATIVGAIEMAGYSVAR
jgi:copper chaperone